MTIFIGLADKPCTGTSPSSLTENLVKQNQDTQHEVKDNLLTPHSHKKNLYSNICLKSPVSPQPVSEFSQEESQMLIEAKCDGNDFTPISKTEADVTEDLAYVIPTVKIGNSSL